MFKTGSVANKAQEQSLPLEAYALPDWFADLLPKEAVFNSEKAMSTTYDEYYKVTENEKAIDYCITKLSNVFSEESIKTGVTTAERYSMKTTQPEQYKEYDETLHQAVRNRLIADKQYVKYMELLEIRI